MQVLQSAEPAHLPLSPFHILINHLSLLPHLEHFWGCVTYGYRSLVHVKSVSSVVCIPPGRKPKAELRMSLQNRHWNSPRAIGLLVICSLKSFQHDSKGPTHYPLRNSKMYINHQARNWWSTFFYMRFKSQSSTQQKSKTPKKNIISGKLFNIQSLYRVNCHHLKFLLTVKEN